MKTLPVILFIFLSFCVRAQTGDMRVYTVAGSLTATTLGDDGPATAAQVWNTEGIWMDGSCNLFLSDMGHSRIRKVNTISGVITTIAGVGFSGYTGDGGPGTNAKIKAPYGLYADATGNVYFADFYVNVVRRIDASTGIITTFAGGGTDIAEGVPATSAKLNQPHNVYGDSVGNILIAETGRIRKVSATTGKIVTIAGTGIAGYSGDGGPATAAQLSAGVAGMVFDAHGNLIIADRNNCRIRKIDAHTNVITTIAGTTTFGYSGDGGLATNAELRGVISVAIDNSGNLVIGDNGNDVIRKVDMTSGIITTIAGVGMSTPGSSADGASATATAMHPEFVYLDLDGNIYYSNYGSQIRKIVHFNPGLPVSGSRCGTLVSTNEQSNIASLANLRPNPANDDLFIDNINEFDRIVIVDNIGRVIYEKVLPGIEHMKIDIKSFREGMYFAYLYGKTNFKVIKFMKI